MKGVLKVSKEQVLEVERYCDEHGITRSQRINELGISRRAYYYTHRQLSEEELHGGRFLPISGSGSSLAHSSRSGRKSGRNAASQSDPMTIELLLPSGTQMRLMGSFSAEMLSALIVNV